VRTATFEIAWAKAEVIGTHLSSISEDVWVTLDKYSEPYQEVPPASIVRPELILEAARMNKRSELQEMIANWVEIPVHVWRQAIHSAASAGSVAVIELFLEREGAFVNPRVWDGALYYATESGHLHLVELLLKRAHAEMEVLDVKFAWRLAARDGRIDICKILFQYGKKQLSYWDRVSTCEKYRSSNPIEEMLFLVEGENFALYSREQLNELTQCLERAALPLLHAEIDHPNAGILLSSLMSQMNKCEKSRPILLAWLDRVANMDRGFRLLQIVLDCAIPLMSGARREFLKAVFQDEWRWNHSGIVTNRDLLLRPAVEVERGALLDADAQPLHTQILSDLANPHVDGPLDLPTHSRKARDFVERLLALPGEAISCWDRGELLHGAVATRDSEIVKWIIKSGEIFPGHWRNSREIVDVSPEITALLERHRPRSIRLFFMEYWHKFSSWISTKWREFCGKYLPKRANPRREISYSCRADLLRRVIL
jgi:hypothetical protein